MKTTGMMVVAAVLSGIGLSRSADAQDSAPDVRMLGRETIGSPCPEGSVRIDSSAAPEACVLMFNKFAVSGGDRASCLIRIVLEYPAGWSFSLSAVEPRGSAHLAAGER